MLANIKKNKTNGWIITPLEGNFAGQEVMTVDGLTLDQVVFEDGGFRGRVRGIWGAVIPDELDLDRATLKGLGVAGVFIPRADTPMHLVGGKCFNTRTGEPVTQSSHILLMGHEMFYNARSSRAKG